MSDQQDPRQRFPLPRRAILRGRESFRLLFEEGRSIRSGPILLKYRLCRESDPQQKQNPVRTAFIVGRRYGRAVDRNRLRRVMRECWRHQLPELLDRVDRLPEPVSVELGLVWTGPPANRVKADYHEICREIEQATTRLLDRLALRPANRGDQ